MKKSEVKEMSNEKLMVEFYWVTVRGTKEENSRNGRTKQTVKDETLILTEMIKRFDLDEKELHKGMNPELYS